MSFKRFRVLLVEDDPDLCEIIKDKLAIMGFEYIRTAHDGDDGMKALQSAIGNAKFDLVIADWKMPKLSGMDLLRYMRSHAFYSKTPFVMLTGVDDEQHVKEALAVGVSDYLVKPFDQKLFHSKITRVMRQISDYSATD